MAKSWACRFILKAILCIWLLPAQDSSAAEPVAPRFQFDIPAAPLDEALARFSAQSGVSVGLSGDLPRLRTGAIKGEFTAQQALERMLSASSWQPVAIGAAAFRLSPREAPADRVLNEALPRLDEVVVTAAKREQSLRAVPMAMTVISGKELLPVALASGSRAALRLDAATSSTNLGPGRERQFIRGVADSAFLGPSQATVSVQFDDARANYDAPDPELLLLDVAQVEILKGPQGPLYGTGALGGVYHIVPRRPDLTQFDLVSTLQAQQMESGGGGVGGDLILNAPIAPGRVAVRALAYAVTDPGWIDNTGARGDANDTRIRGGRLALRGQLSSDWTLDLQGVAQVSQSADSQYVTDSPHRLQRSGVLTEPHDNDFYLGSATAQGHWLGRHALLTASVIQHESDGLLDASAAAAAWNEAAPLRYRDRRRYRLTNQELRLWSDESSRLSWLAGLSYLSAHSDLTGTLEPFAAPQRDVLRLSQRVDEAAVFGELSMPVRAAWRLTGGLRAFRSGIENEGEVASREEGDDRALYSVTPSLSLDWRSADAQRFAFLRYARAVRPGGLAAELRRFDADELSNVDLGTRLMLHDGALAVESAVFVTRWSHIQSDYLLDNGLVGTRNAGSGRIFGVEGSARWTIDDAWRFESTLTLQHARLTRAAIEVTQDSRLPVVPEQRARVSAVRVVQWGGWQAQWRGDLNYVGSSRLSFEAALDRKTSDYLRADLGFELRRGGLAWTLAVNNVLNSRADTFAYGNPFSVRSRAQYTPLAPLSITMGVVYSPAR